ncbi:MAG: NAD(P)-binding domain-containing protein [Candidatus Krumholzibacteria bacterium]|nr:NAD(P)-binding domain-containing protein [Candidatus Krumholzibacteria bacterium]
MTEQQTTIAIAALIVPFVVAYWWRAARDEKRATRTFEHTVATGLEPVSLHPSIDPNRCIAVGTCVDACLEGEILGIVNGTAELIHPTRCIGHGTCAAACPVDAITLVFGTERRGVDIPEVRDTFETNVERIYIAGELGGMGLIRNAVTQGKEAIDNIAKRLDSSNDPAVYDVAIVGAGPAGISATLEAAKKGLRYVTLDQYDIGGTVRSYPRHKIVMTQPMDLPLYGKCRFREIEKEQLLAIWEEVIGKTGVAINTGEKVETVARRNGHYEIATSKAAYAARVILLAIGRRGTPRKLGVPGEETSKVTYNLIEPKQYAERSVLVVGGGDSAVEAALAIAKQPGSDVTLSYRKSAFARVKDKNRDSLEEAQGARRVDVVLESQVQTIAPESVVLDAAGRPLEIRNDFVLVFIGGELPTAFLRKLGVRIDTKFGEA